MNLKKVKAHSGDIHNDQVDSLAKEGRNLTEIIWKDPRRPIWSVLPVWNSLTIDISTRDFMKEIHTKETVVEWSQQNRVQKRWTKEIREQDQYSWKNFWSQCRQGSTLQTSLKQAKERNFRIKLINDELPTLRNLKIRKPEIYRDTTCILCRGEEESLEHLFTCPALTTDRTQIWEEAERKVTKKLQEFKSNKDGDTENSRGNSTPKLLQVIRQWKTFSRKPGQDLINKCLGLFSSQERQVWNGKAREDGIRGSASQAILDIFSQSLLKLFRKRIWIPWCERVIAWERIQGISGKGKKSKIRKVTSNKRGRKSRIDKNPEPIGELRKDPDDDMTRQRTRKEGEGSASLGEKVVETVWDWIKKGKKWVGY